MFRTLLCLCVSAVVGLVFAADAPADKPPVRKVEIKYSCEIAEVPAGAKTVDLWVPIATSDDRQTVKLLNESELTGGRFTTDKQFGNRIFYRRFEAPYSLPIQLQLIYDVEVHEATVPQAKTLISTQQVTPDPEFAPYLAETIGSTWVTLAHGRDVILEPPQQSEPINMFDEPIAKADAKPLHVTWKGHYKDHAAVAANKAAAN